jgi:hypothetical protein
MRNWPYLFGKYKLNDKMFLKNTLKSAEIFCTETQYEIFPVLVGFRHFSSFSFIVERQAIAVSDCVVEDRNEPINCHSK